MQNKRLKKFSTKGFPKGGGGGGGPTFGKNSQIISFFLFDSVPYSMHGLIITHCIPECNGVEMEMGCCGS